MQIIDIHFRSFDMRVWSCEFVFQMKFAKFVQNCDTLKVNGKSSLDETLSTFHNLFSISCEFWKFQDLWKLRYNVRSSLKLIQWPTVEKLENRDESNSSLQSSVVMKMDHRHLDYALLEMERSKMENVM